MAAEISICNDISSKESVKYSSNLINFLKENDFYESNEEAKTRERALGRLDFLLKNFVKEIAKKKGENRNIGGRIHTFGSFRLGVHDKGADIDTLCVVPKQITRREFFSRFYEMLENEEMATELSKAEDAYVPVIKMKFMGISIDLTMCRIMLPVIDNKLDLLNDKLLKNLDEKCIMSLNGARVTDKMLSLVPNTEVFHTALKTIKMWAKRRAVYGNAYGYFGGVAYSISMAKICQLYPNYCAYDILCKYFEIYSAWEWPSPVQLVDCADPHYNLKIWDPVKYPADRFHKMPIITPAYPSMCSTHNVSQSTYNVIVKEFQRSVDLIKISESFEDFTRIFDYTDFFKRYRVYVKVTIEAEKEGFKGWSGYVESKIRVLATKIELVENVTLSVPFPKMFTKDEEGSFFIGIEVDKSNTTIKKLYLDEQIKEFTAFLNNWNLKTPDMKITVVANTKKEAREFLKRNQ